MGFFWHFLRKTDDFGELIRIYADDKTLELIISPSDLLRRELPERWIKSPISESP
jgi:hypothetical protein